MCSENLHMVSKKMVTATHPYVAHMHGSVLRQDLNSLLLRPHLVIGDASIHTSRTGRQSNMSRPNSIKKNTLLVKGKQKKTPEVSCLHYSLADNKDKNCQYSVFSNYFKLYLYVIRLRQ